MPDFDLDNLFSYHAPQGDQPGRYDAIRAAGKHLAKVILDHAPSCADRTVAIRRVREAVMYANASIALERATDTAEAPRGPTTDTPRDQFAFHEPSTLVTKR